MKRIFRHETPAAAGLDVGVLAPMVDMMTLLLVFLLRTYSTESAPSPPSGPFALAPTSSEDARRGGTEILVTAEALWVDGQRVAAWEFVQGEGVVRPLYDRLLASRSKGRVEVYADGGVEWRELSRVLATARSAGYADLSLVGGYRGSL